MKKTITYLFLMSFLLSIIFVIGNRQISYKFIRKEEYLNQNSLELTYRTYFFNFLISNKIEKKYSHFKTIGIGNNLPRYNILVYVDSPITLHNKYVNKTGYELINFLDFLNRNNELTNSKLMLPIVNNQYELISSGKTNYVEASSVIKDNFMIQGQNSGPGGQDLVPGQDSGP